MYIKDVNVKTTDSTGRLTSDLTCFGDRVFFPSGMKKTDMLSDVSMLRNLHTLSTLKPSQKLCTSGVVFTTHDIGVYAQSRCSRLGVASTQRRQLCVLGSERDMVSSLD